MRAFSFLSLLVVPLLACGSDGNNNNNGDDVDAGCVGAGCSVQTECEKQGKPNTSISGTVYAPNGTLPLHGVHVYIPESEPGPLPEGVVCSRCTDELPGGSLLETITDGHGRFTLIDPPVGENIPLVITTGKWRRQVSISSVEECKEHALSETETSLPSHRGEGDMPKIAISTGDLDAIECLIPKLGIADTEITTDTQGGSVHFYANTDLNSGRGTDRFAINFDGGSGRFTDSQELWGNLEKLDDYDIVMFSCEGLQYARTKPQEAMDAVKAYADMGGRVYLSHWQNVWIEGSTTNANYTQKPAEWPSVATFSDSSDFLSNTHGTVDTQAHAKGQAFSDWLLFVGASISEGLVPIASGRNTCSGVDSNKTERWIYLDENTSGGATGVQIFQFNTPVEGPADQACGRVVFSDMHVSADSQSNSGGNGFPVLCSDGPLTPQEKALAFMFFEIGSCLGPIL
jgi:hypothetical protein